ncbi:hypothetical protein DPMN_063803 [Dreissena polymorpha]|uniref:Uncharacterized protein n=1 Tax=Dreissena polymorpha TaxID=45954 RepID=A0A9D4CC19_DREPO|nr:hypothetical protein DPMN_063803 [Dreissena polymorpha]
MNPNRYASIRTQAHGVVDLVSAKQPGGHYPANMHIWVPYGLFLGKPIWVSPYGSHLGPIWASPYGNAHKGPI